MRFYRALRWLMVAAFGVLAGLGSMLYVAGMVLIGWTSPARWRRWLRHARGESGAPAQAAQTVVEVINRFPDGTPQVVPTTDRAPIRAEHRDAQRELIAYAERVTGRKMSWGQVRKWARLRQRAGML